MTGEQPTARIIIEDDNANWVRWGELLRSWIDQPTTRPTTTGALVVAMKEKGVNGSVPGPDREFGIYNYSETGPLWIGLPSKEMFDAKWRKTANEGPYCMPNFYAVAFGGAGKVNLTRDEARAFALRRFGEYVVNQCC